MQGMFSKCQGHYARQLPFVLFRKPNAKQVIALLQQDTTLHYVRDFSAKGFVFAPFSGEDCVIFPEDQCEVEITAFEPRISAVSQISSKEIENSAAKKQHIELVTKGIKQITNGDFSKVVLSRRETVSISNFDLFETFHKLATAYPSAFAYCFFHPKLGLWLGAFSEQLIFEKERNFSTMAVAGSQLYNEQVAASWGPKEKYEQQLVTDFIVSNLKELSTELVVSEPYTLRAGNLVHIKTDIQGKIKGTIPLEDLLSILHPTPAVCGFPRDAAMDFIIKNEGYDRGFYSGFLGELNFDFETKEFASDLYVNLRCMQIEGNLAHIYVGGGITADSDAESEWLETVNKSQTMKKILF